MDTKNQAPSSEELQQQSFDAWVEAMELEHFKQQRELAKIAIERSRQSHQRREMPNHCYNEIQIVSDKGLEPIRKLIVNENKLPLKDQTELTGDTQLIDFNLVAPQRFDSSEPEVFAGWYEWNCENWGTKWNAYECEILMDCNGKYNDILEIKFTTAWCPPEAWVKRLAEKLFEYDPDANICGFIALKVLRTLGHGMCFTMMEPYNRRVFRDGQRSKENNSTCG